MKVNRLGGILAIGALCLAGCSSGSGASTSPAASTGASSPAASSGSSAAAGSGAPSGGTILLGGIAGTTGAYGSTGQAVVNGTQVAVDEINAAGGVLGKELKFDWHDDGADPTISSQLFNQYVSDGAVAIAGSPDTGPTTVTLSEQKGFPIIGAVDDCGLTVYTKGPDQPPSPYAFCTSLNTFAWGGAIGRYALANCKALGVLHDPSTYGMGGLAGIKGEYDKAGKQLALEESITENWSTGATVGLKSEIDKLTAAGVDCVDVWLTPQDQASFIQEARSLGSTFKVFGNDETNADATFSDLAGAQADGMISAAITTRLTPSPELTAFQQAYKQRFGVDSTPFAELSYDAVKLLKKAIEDGGATDPASLQKQFNQITAYPGLTGSLTFNEQQHTTLNADQLTMVKFNQATNAWEPVQ
jgi:ABC-type branched-subunit amino acid transport system substrate-binding protein